MVKTPYFSFRSFILLFSSLVPVFCKTSSIMCFKSIVISIFLVWGLPAVAQGQALQNKIQVKPKSKSVAQFTVSQNGTKASQRQILKTTSKKGVFKKKEKEVISKNLTPAEQLQLSSQKWNFIFGTSASRSRDELSDYFGSLNGSLAYQLNSKFLITSGIVYEYLAYKREGDFLVNEDNTRQFGVSDLRIGFSMPRSINLPELKSFINFSGNVFLPTSYNSRDAGQYYAMNLTANMISFLTPKLLLSSFGSILHGAHQFEEANATGTALNSPLGFRIGGSLSYNLVKDLTVFGGYNINTRYEYSNGLRTIQFFSSGVQYALNSKTYISGSFFWQDQFVTNDVLFDDDNSFYAIGIDYIL